MRFQRVAVVLQQDPDCLFRENNMRFQSRTRRLPATFLVVLALAFAAASASSAGAQVVRQASTESLIYDLKNPDAARRLVAARDLGTAKYLPAIPALLPLAEDPDAAVRRQVELVFEEMGDIRVLPGLVQLTADSEPDIRDRAVQALVSLHLPRATGLTPALLKLGNLINPWSDEYSDTVVEPDVPVDASVVTALRARMSDSEDRIRRNTSRGLGILHGEAAIPELLVALGQDRDPEVRFEAVRALRKIGNPSVGDRLLPMLNLNMDKVRNELITTLGSLKYRGAVPELTRIFEQGKPAERSRTLALSALADIADPSSRPVFLGAKADKDVGIRLYANEGLARLGDSSFGTMMSADRLVEKNLRVQAAQAFGLLRMGREEYLEELVRALGRPTTRDLAREYLLETQPAQRPALFAMHAKSAIVRAELADVIGLMGDRSALPALQELERDSDRGVARNAERAVRRITAGTQHFD
jgi:HEAT repeat protein